jgi:hypothetical protein
MKIKGRHLENSRHIGKKSIIFLERQLRDVSKKYLLVKIGQKWTGINLKIKVSPFENYHHLDDKYFSLIFLGRQLQGVSKKHLHFEIGHKHYENTFDGHFGFLRHLERAKLQQVNFHNIMSELPKW